MKVSFYRGNVSPVFRKQFQAKYVFATHLEFPKQMFSGRAEEEHSGWRRPRDSPAPKGPVTKVSLGAMAVTKKGP